MFIWWFVLYYMHCPTWQPLCNTAFVLQHKYNHYYYYYYTIVLRRPLPGELENNTVPTRALGHDRDQVLQQLGRPLISSAIAELPFVGFVTILWRLPLFTWVFRIFNGVFSTSIAHQANDNTTRGAGHFPYRSFPLPDVSPTNQIAWRTSPLPVIIP